MKNYLFALLITLLFVGCKEDEKEKEVYSLYWTDWLESNPKDGDITSFVFDYPVKGFCRIRADINKHPRYELLYSRYRYEHPNVFLSDFGEYPFQNPVLVDTFDINHTYRLNWKVDGNKLIGYNNKDSVVRVLERHDKK